MTLNSLLTRASAVLVSLVCAALSPPAIGDCAGPPTTPIVKVRITECSVSTSYDSTLRLKGKARRVLVLHHAGGTESGEAEISHASGDVDEDTFWITVSEDTGCDEFLQTAETIWLYGDICNDTGQNIPDLQLITLWPEIKAIAEAKLVSGSAGDT